MIALLRANLDLIQTAIALLGVVGTVIALWYAGRQLRDSKRSAQGDFLFRFDEMLNRYDSIHKQLRPGGGWTSGKPITLDDWPDVERYMGLFERVKILIDDGFIDIDTFDRLYGYRIDNITNNQQIKTEKLIKRAYGWKDFNALVQALERRRKRGTR